MLHQSGPHGIKKLPLCIAVNNSVTLYFVLISQRRGGKVYKVKVLHIAEKHCSSTILDYWLILSSNWLKYMVYPQGSSLYCKKFPIDK